MYATSLFIDMHKLAVSCETNIIVVIGLERFLDPLTSGKYPDSMRRIVGARLPRFTPQEAKELKGSFDFLGLNYYTTYFTINNPHPPNPRHTDYILDARAILSCRTAYHSFNTSFILFKYFHRSLKCTSCFDPYRLIDTNCMCFR